MCKLFLAFLLLPLSLFAQGMTSGSGFGIDTDTGRFSIGVEAFFPRRSPVGTANFADFKRELPAGFRVMKLYSVSLALRPPIARITDGLFRILVGPTQWKEDAFIVYSVILKST